ncbi:hypothetical protein RZS08_40685, partial [Arthrospira platensis SPKY1]|nr:hypothetical protein [Arthrospira platensis SPKY1]
ETHRTLAVIAEQKRQQIEAWLDETRGDAELHFGDHSQLHHLLARWQSARDDALLSQMRELADRLARNRGWSGLAVFDASGQVVFSIGQIEIEPHRRQIADVLSNPGVQLVDLYRGTGGDVH